MTTSHIGGDRVYKLRDFKNLSQINSSNFFRYTSPIESSYLRNKPIIFYTQNSEKYSNLFQSGSVKCPPKIEFRSLNSFLCDKGILLTRDDEILKESTDLPNNIGRQNSFYNTDGENYARDSVDTEIVNAEKILYFGKRGIQNYGHFLVEIAPILHQCTLRKEYGEYDLVIHGESIRNAEEIVNFSTGRNVNIKRVSGDINFQEAIVPLSWVKHPLVTHPDTILHWENILKDRYPRSNHRSRIYIKRPPSDGRKLINEDFVVDLLLRRDFKVVDTSAMSFEEQVRIFSCAEIIVSVAGAALTNMIFSPAGTRVLCLAPETMPAVWFWDIANIKKIEISFIYGESFGEKNIFSDFAVDERVFSDFLDEHVISKK